MIEEWNSRAFRVVNISYRGLVVQRIWFARDSLLEVVKLRELAANLINESLAAANSDIRVDHRSFKYRGIERAPTTHLGPAATEMERRGEPSAAQ